MDNKIKVTSRKWSLDRLLTISKKEQITGGQNELEFLCKPIDVYVLKKIVFLCR